MRTSAFCGQVEGNTLSPTLDDTGRKRSKSSKVSSWEQTESNTPSYIIKNNSGRSKRSKIRSSEQKASDALSLTIENNVRLQKSALSSKYKRHIYFTILKGVYVQKVLIVYTMK